MVHTDANEEPAGVVGGGGQKKPASKHGKSADTGPCPRNQGDPCGRWCPRAWSQDTDEDMGKVLTSHQTPFPGVTGSMSRPQTRLHAPDTCDLASVRGRPVWGTTDKMPGRQPPRTSGHGTQARRGTWEHRGCAGAAWGPSVSVWSCWPGGTQCQGGGVWCGPRLWWTQVGRCQPWPRSQACGRPLAPAGWGDPGNSCSGLPPDTALPGAGD